MTLKCLNGHNGMLYPIMTGIITLLIEKRHTHERGKTILRSRAAY